MNKKFLRKLIKESSPSGYEKPAYEIWRKEANKIGSVHGDYHGNSYATVNSQPNPNPSILLAGHIDEVGLMITSIDNNGFLKIKSVGGIDVQNYVGQRVKIYSKDRITYGVVARKAIHLLKYSEYKKTPKQKDIWIDIGVDNKKQAKRRVSIGDVATIDVDYRRVNKYHVSKGFDDKLGAFIILEVLKQVNTTHQVTAVATVQEEIGLRGATTSSYNVNPDIGIAVDVTHTSDIPGVSENDISLGDGAIISKGPNINPKLFQLLVDTAENNDIPYKIEVSPRGTGTDANAIQLSRGGVATGLVSIPNRYMHSPIEMVNLDDVENIIKLLTKTISNIKNSKDFIL